MNNKESNLNFIINSKINNLKNFPMIPLSRDEKELIYLMKKYNFSNKIVMTEFDLFKYNEPLKKINSKHELNNKKLLDQVDLIYNKIYKEKIPQKSQSRKILHDMLFNYSENNENSHINKRILFQNKIDESQNPVRKKILPKLFSSELSRKIFNLNLPKENLIINNNSNNIDENNIFNGNSFSHSNNSLDKNKKFYYLSKPNKNNKKKKLTPINRRFHFKCHKLKLNVNNDVDYSDQKHEEMMKMYKEIEYRNKNRFMI